MTLLTAYSYFIWYKYGKDDHVAPVVTFDPPGDMNSLYAEIFFKGKATMKGVISLIFYFAGKGYLKIYQAGKDFVLEKIKDYDGNNKVEKTLMMVMFPQKTITRKDLDKSDAFWCACGNIISNGSNSKAVFSKSSTSVKNQVKMFLPLLGIDFLLFANVVGYEPIVLIFVFMAISVFHSFALTLLLEELDYLHIGMALIFGGMPTLVFYGMGNFHFTTIQAFGLICIIVSFVCLKQLPKRFGKSNDAYRQLMGFKKFIDMTHQDNLQKLMDENPKDFYGILAYAYALSGKFDKVNKRKIIKYFGNISDPTGARRRVF